MKSIQYYKDTYALILSKIERLERKRIDINKEIEILKKDAESINDYIVSQN